MYRQLDAMTISDIALLFIEGDFLENVLLDKCGHTDYDFEKFTALKRVLTSVENIEPCLDISAVLWQPHVINKYVGAPLVAGNSLPHEGCKRRRLSKEIQETMEQDKCLTKHWEDGTVSLYRAVKNSSDEIVGVLELIEGLTEKIDVSVMDMFAKQVQCEGEDL